MSQRGLLFDPGPEFPTLWIIGLILFLGCWWYTVRHTATGRRTFLAFWVPAALVAALAYRLSVQGQAVADTLRLLVRRDVTTWRELVRPPADSYAAIYGVVVGGTAAVFATMAWQLAGLVVGSIVGLFLPGGRGRRT